MNLAVLRYCADKIFSKGHNSGKAHNLDKKKKKKKKNKCQLFFMRNPYMKFHTLACTVQNFICYASKCAM